MTAPPTARTFVAGETETAAFMNSVAAAVNFILDPPRCRATQTGTPQGLGTSGTYYAVLLNTEDFDTDTMHSTVTNTSRITATTSGLYEVTAQVAVAQNGTNQRKLFLSKNATGQFAEAATNGTAGTATTFNVTGKVYLAVGDYVEVYAMQNSGVSLNLSVGAGEVFLEAIWKARS